MTILMKSLFKTFFLLIIALSACNKESYSNLNDGLYADIHTNKGDILLALEYEHVPITVANFISLAEGTNVYVSENFRGKPFYDGLIFHRVLDDFMIQGGDPLANGTGGPGYKFEDEFPVNDAAQIMFPHDKKGILSMANGGPDGNGSQFFITHKATPWLDGIHTVFGHVVKGSEVVDSIAQNDIMETIKIIRIGKEAKKFDASNVFSDYFKNLEEKSKLEAENLQATKTNFLNLKNKREKEAIAMPSGLKIFYLKKGAGEKPNIGNKVNVFYSGFFTTGDLFTSNNKETAQLYHKYDGQRALAGGYDPVPMDYSPDAQLMPGVKEALLEMKTGDKVMIFIPSHLGYGPQGYQGVIPPNTDLIFELEIVD